MIPRILKNFNLYVDGKSYAGKVEELELPEISFKVEEYRGGGMDGAKEIDMGQEVMSAKYTFADPDPDLIRLVGKFASGSRVLARGAFVSDRDGATVPVVAEMGGNFKKLTLGTWKAGDKATQQYEQSVDYFRLEVGGTEVMEIDVENMVRRIGGVDQLAQIRNAIGL